MSPNLSTGPLNTELVAVAVPVPLYGSFDYAVPERLRGRLQPGMRLRVPFGRRELIGVVLEPPREAPDASDYKLLLEALDDAPLVPRELLALARWAAEYYRHPAGEVLSALMPGPLRRGQTPEIAAAPWLALTASGREHMA